ncbi:MAG TPA: YhjD/YihY/BrkB family envelope integrity protein [Trueperaceae bacterium]|nr:YhjD/YihY/BrkB family envelope integrity protein [Trueperaceae bacterium]
MRPSPDGGARRFGLAAWAFLRRLYQRFNESRLQMLAAALAYYAAFSLGPLLLLLAGWLAVFLQNRPEIAAEYRATLISLLAEVMPLQIDATAAVTRSFDVVVNDLSKGAVISTILSLVVLIWASGNFFTSLQHALEVIFEVEERRTFWRKRLIAVLLVAGVAMVVGFEIIGGVIVSTLREAGAALTAWLNARGLGAPTGPGVFEPLADVRWARVAAMAGSFMLAFRYLPRRSSSWLGALSGALVSTFGIVIMRALLRITFNAERFNLIYGVITSLLAVLLWLYLALLLTLVGAVVAAEVSAADRRAKGSVEDVAEPG